MLSQLRTWWQLWTGEYETPFDDGIPAWLISVAVHLGVLLAIGFLAVPTVREAPTLTLTAPVVDPVEEVEPQTFEFQPFETDVAGTDGIAGESISLSQAPVIDMSRSVAVPELGVANPMAVELSESVLPVTGLAFNDRLVTRGAVGVAATGASGAVDRLTAEILAALEERPTLVVWLFDQSASLIRQRQEIHDRIGRIYTELGDVVGRYAAGGNKTPLLGSIVAFGADVQLLTEKPLDDPQRIQELLLAIERDDSGRESVFRAVYAATERYKRLRTRNERNVLCVVFTDEAGDDDAEYLDAACRIAENSRSRSTWSASRRRLDDAKQP